MKTAEKTGANSSWRSRGGLWKLDAGLYALAGGRLGGFGCGDLSAVLCGVPYHGAGCGVRDCRPSLLALLLWITWIRRAVCFGGGGMMEQVHQVVLSHLDFDGARAASGSRLRLRAIVHPGGLMWPEAKVTGIDYWGADFGYNQTMCEKNAASEGVAARCRFRHGDANSWTSRMRASTPW